MKSTSSRQTQNTDAMDVEAPTGDMDADEEDDFGWKTVSHKKKSKSKASSSSSSQTKSKRQQDDVDDEFDDLSPTGESSSSSTSEIRRRLLKELSARLHRDMQLRYAQREFEMQRLMMGKGAKQKIAATEKMGEDEDSEDDEDTIDARKGKVRTRTKVVDEATYKPRVYKWKLERRR